MNLKVCAVFLLFAFIQNSFAARMTLEEKNKFCSDNLGATFHDGCNHCVCSTEKTGESVCNLVPCPEHFDHANSQLSPPSQEIPSQPNCAGFNGVTFTDGCNTCRCSKDPTNAACTRKGCRADQRKPCSDV
uniref:CSON001032 protein n=1 Tax=Culicoides sonorensis TaxID=179676 RepID=A0A336LTN5_CULSO